MFGATDPLIYQYYDTIADPFYGMDSPRPIEFTPRSDPFYGMDSPPDPFYGMDSPRSIEPDGSGFSFMDTDDEGEFYDPSETGGYAVDLEDFRADDESEFYDPIAQQSAAVAGFDRSLLNIARTFLGNLGSKENKGRLISALPNRREMERQYGSPVGSVGGRLPLSNMQTEQTRMLQLANFMKAQAADARQRGNLDNLPLPRIGPTPSASRVVNLGDPKLKPTLASRQRQAAMVRG